MRGRLLTNGILSLVGLILFIVIVVLKVEIIELNNSNPMHTWNQQDYANAVNSDNLFPVYAAMLSILILVNIATFVMGIITLSMRKHDGARGLTIASGILGIFSGMLGVGAIISFIGFEKAK